MNTQRLIKYCDLLLYTTELKIDKFNLIDYKRKLDDLSTDITAYECEGIGNLEDITCRIEEFSNYIFEITKTLKYYSVK